MVYINSISLLYECVLRILTNFLSKNLIKVKIYLGLLMVTLGMKDDYGQATFLIGSSLLK